MKEYHTSIEINAPVEKVWSVLTDFLFYPEWNPVVGKLEGLMQEGEKISTYIIPLAKTYFPVLLSYKINQELVWKGVQGANFLLAGKHYYKLEKLWDGSTRLFHGEYFSGLFSFFIQPELLNKMENAFILHNQLLKQRAELPSVLSSA